MKTRKAYLKPSVVDFNSDNQLNLLLMSGGGNNGGGHTPGPGPGPRPGKKSSELGDGIDYNPFKTDDEY